MADDASEAFQRFLSRIEQGGNADFEAFRREHPHLSAALEARYRAWKDGASLRTGAEAGPRGGSLPGGEPSAGGAAESSIHERVRNLASRGIAESRYSLEGELARGGMGVVHRVFDNDLRRTLAMKRMFGRAEADALPAVGRFLEEAQITGQLDHPGVVPVHELGVDGDGRAFFTMRMVRGRTLDEIFALARKGEEGWNLPRAAGVVVRVCETMAYAHSKGVIHRDLKPSNVMVGKFGETYVMDWGLAKVLGRPERREPMPKPDSGMSMTQVRTDRVEDAAKTPGSPLLTLEGAVIGTPFFMPPEQAAGRLDALDARSDVYSVGALLYVLLSGTPPYAHADASPISVLQALLQGPPRAIEELDAAAPSELVAVCEKAMAREPGDRYPGMLEMAEDIRAWLEGRVVRAYETGTWAQARKWLARNRALSASILGGLLLLLAGTFAFAWQQRRQVRQLSSAHQQTLRARDEARENERIAQANEEKARRRSYVANLAAADASLRVHRTLEAAERLDRCEPALRGWEWRHLRLMCDTSVARVDGEAGRVNAVAFAPGGERVVAALEGKIVRLFEAGSGQPLFDLPGCTDAATSLSLSDDGSRAAAGCLDNFVRIWDARTGRLSLALSGHEAGVVAVAFAPGGARLASASSDGEVRLWQAPEWRCVSTLAGDSAHAVAWSADGALLAVGRDDRVELVDPRSGEVQRTLEGHDGVVCGVAFAPQGALLASASLDGTARLWDSATGAERGRFEGDGDPFFSVAFSPDGSGLAAGSLDQTVRLFDVATGRRVALFLGHEDAVRSVAFHPAGRLLLSGSADGTVRFWDIEESGAMRIRRCGGALVTGAAPEPGGRRIAVATAEEGAVRMLDIEERDRAGVLGSGLGYLNAVAWGRKGSLLATGGEEDSTVRLFDPGGGVLLRTLLGHEASVTCVAISPDGASVLSGSADNSVRLWNAETGESIRVLKGHESRVACVAYSPDGLRLASGSFDRTARIWQADGTPLRTIQGHGGAVLSVAFDPRRPRVATSSEDGTVRLWDLDEGGRATTLRAGGVAVASVAFLPDGSRVAGGCRDKSVRIWDAESGELLLSLRGHEGWVTSVAFASGGRDLVTAAFDGTVRIWRGG